MKKLLTVVLSLLLLCTTLPVSAWMGEVSTQTETPVLQAGDKVTFTVSVFGLQLKSLALKLGTAFDPEVFTFVSGKWLVKGLLSDVDTEKLNAVIAFTKETTLDNEAVFSFTLRVREDAPACDPRVGVTAVMSSEDMTQEVGQMASGCRLTVNGGKATTLATDSTVTTVTTVLPGAADSTIRPVVEQNSSALTDAVTTIPSEEREEDATVSTAASASVPLDEPLIGLGINSDAWLLLGAVVVTVIAVAIIGIVAFRNRRKASTQKGDMYGDSTE